MLHVLQTLLVSKTCRSSFLLLKRFYAGCHGTSHRFPLVEEKTKLLVENSDLPSTSMCLGCPMATLGFVLLIFRVLVGGGFLCTQLEITPPRHLQREGGILDCLSSKGFFFCWFIGSFFHHSDVSQSFGPSVSKIRVASTFSFHSGSKLLSFGIHRLLINFRSSIGSPHRSFTVKGARLQPLIHDEGLQKNSFAPNNFHVPR